jgi:predicted nucleotidyltransferase
MRCVNLPLLLADRVTALVARHPEVRGIELAGSRATGHARPDSDWDFLVEARDFGAVAAALPELLAPLEPLAQQWDRLSDEQCWMLILRGPVKVDLIFPEEPHVHEPPWAPSTENLDAIDAHLWDWLLWLRSKERSGKDELVPAELEKLFVHLLRPLGAECVPSSVADAVELYRPARDAQAARFGCPIAPALEAEVAPALAAS